MGVEAAEISRLEAQLAREREHCRRLEAQLGNLADHDPLTDLLNRRSALHELEAHLARCTRYGPEGVILLVGLDGLDDIAVAGGPAQADEALAALAERVRDRLRTLDVVGRWEPDELVVLLPKAAAAGGAILAASMVEIVAGTATAAVAPGSLVASVGVAPVVAATPAGAGPLLARARHAMEAARRGGGGWALAEG